MATFFRVSKLIAPVAGQEDVDIFRRIVRYLRNELNSVESSLAKLELIEDRQRSVEVLGQLTGEIGHYLDHTAEACQAVSGEILQFDPRQVLRPLWGIFEFKAGQKDITLEILADQDFPETVSGREKVFRGLFVLVLSYILHLSKSGGTVRCNLRRDTVCEFQCATEENEDPSSVEVLIETLLSYLIRKVAKNSGISMEVNETDRTCSFEITQRMRLPEAPEEKCEDIPEEFVALEPEHIVPVENPIVPLEEACPELVASEPESNEPYKEEWKEPEAVTLKVIIAEDNALSQKFLRRIVEGEGYDAVCVSNGRELISRLEREPFDVCLLDCQMGVLDGYKVTGIIRANEARLGRRTRIIGMATHLDVDNEDRCLQAGMDAYLSKPIHKGMLVDLLKRFAR